jgi:hypothetical protein
MMIPPVVLFGDVLRMPGNGADDTESEKNKCRFFFLEKMAGQTVQKML